MLSTRLMRTSSRSSTPSKRTRPSKGRSSSAGSMICSMWPLSPAAAKRVISALTASSGARKSPIRTSWPARGKGSKAGRLSPPWGLAADQLDHPRQRNAPVHRRDAAAEQGQALAAADEEARQRDEQQLGTIAFRRPFRAGEVMRRAVVHRGGGVAPQPDTLRGFPLGFADIEPLRLGALAPIDAGCRIARLVLTELPECLALADAAATMHPLRDGHGDPLSGNEKRRQHRSSLLRANAQRGRRRAAPNRQRRRRPRIGPAHRNGAEICSMTRATVTPSARPAKLTAMRWRSTGGAKARTSSTDGLSRPSISARARQASIRA